MSEGKGSHVGKEMEWVRCELSFKEDCRRLLIGDGHRYGFFGLAAKVPRL